MATANPAQKSGNKYGDLKRRLWFLLGALVMFEALRVWRRSRLEPRAFPVEPAV